MLFVSYVPSIACVISGASNSSGGGGITSDKGRADRKKVAFSQAIRYSQAEEQPFRRPIVSLGRSQHIIRRAPRGNNLKKGPGWEEGRGRESQFQTSHLHLIVSGSYIPCISIRAHSFSK